MNRNPLSLSKLYLHKSFSEYHFFSQEERVMKKQALAKPDCHRATLTTLLLTLVTQALNKNQLFKTSLDFTVR